jgi:hypothetical protein
MSRQRVRTASEKYVWAQNYALSDLVYNIVRHGEGNDHCSKKELLELLRGALGIKEERRQQKKRAAEAEARAKEVRRLEREEEFERFVRDLGLDDEY